MTIRDDKRTNGMNSPKDKVAKGPATPYAKARPGFLKTALLAGTMYGMTALGGAA